MPNAGIVHFQIFIAWVDARLQPQVELRFVFTEEGESMYAVIRSGGKQYRVTPGQTVRLEKLAGETGSKIELGNVLMVEDGGNVRTGSALGTAKIAATIVENGRGNKVLVFKKKRKKQYRRTQGHRQDYTSIRIDQILV